MRLSNNKIPFICKNETASALVNPIKTMQPHSTMNCSFRHVLFWKLTALEDHRWPLVIQKWDAQVQSIAGVPRCNGHVNNLSTAWLFHAGKCSDTNSPLSGVCLRHRERDPLVKIELYILGGKRRAFSSSFIRFAHYKGMGK